MQRSRYSAALTDTLHLFIIYPITKCMPGLTSAKVGVKQGGWQENMLHRRAKTRQMQHILHGLQRIWHVQVAIKGISPLTKLKSGHSGTDGDVGGEQGTNGGRTGDKRGTNGGRTGDKRGLWRMEQGKNLHKKPAALRPLTRGDGAQGRRLAIQNYGTYHSPPSSSVCFLSLLRSSSSSSSGVYSSS